MNKKEKRSYFYFALIVSSLCFLFSYCSRVEASDICRDPKFVFDFEDAQKMVVLGEREQKCTGLLTIKDGIIAEQEKKILTLETAYDKLYEAFEASQQANATYKEVLELKDREMKIMEKQCKEDIKKAKPTLARDAGIAGGGFALGGIAVILIILLL